MKKKVIYLSSVDLSKFNSESFGFNYLKNLNIILEYWYCLFIYNIKKKQKDSVKKNKKTISSLIQFENLIKKEKKKFNIVIVMLLNTKDINSIEIYRVIKKYNIKTVSFLWDLDLTINFKDNGINIIKKIIKKFNLSKNFKNFFLEITAYIKIRLYNKLKLIKDDEVVFYTGSQAKKYLEKQKLSSKLVSINTSAVDNLLKLKNKKKLVKRNYCVFLDSAITSRDHIDKYIYKERDMAGLHKDYFNSLSNFFNIIEKKYNMRVLISRHPKNKLNLKKILKRQVFDYKSPELIKNASLVICHQSLSMNYAVLLSKPIFFIYTKPMLSRSKATINLVNIIKLYSSRLNQYIFNIDEDINLPSLKHIKYDKYKYKSYIKEYLTMNNNKNFFSRKLVYHTIIKLLDQK